MRVASSTTAETWRFVSLLLDTGMRRAQLAGLKTSDVDFEAAVAVVMGRGRRPRAEPFGQVGLHRAHEMWPSPGARGEAKP